MNFPGFSNKETEPVESEQKEIIVEEFIRTMQPYCISEPTRTLRAVSAVLKPNVVNNPKMYDELCIAARSFGATVTAFPKVGFRLLLTNQNGVGKGIEKETDTVTNMPSPEEKVTPQPTRSPVNLNAIPIVLHASDKPTEIVTDGTRDLIAQFPVKDTSMALLTNLDNIPKSVRDFIGRFKLNSIAIFDKNGIFHIEVSMNILDSLGTFQAFLNYYHSVLSEFPTLSPYISLYEATQQINVTPSSFYEHCYVVDTSNLRGPKKKIKKPVNASDKPIPMWITQHFYIVLDAKKMIIDKLERTLRPEVDIDVAKGIDFLAKHDVSNVEMEKTFGIDKRTICRYKAKVAKSPSDNLSLSEQPIDSDVPESNA